MPWKDEREPWIKHSMGRKIGVVKSSPEYRTLDRIDGEPMDFEWNIFQGFNTLQLSQEVQELLLRLNETPENFLKEGSSSCRCSMTSHGDQKTTRENAIQMLVFRATSPLSRGQLKSKGGGKLSIHYCADQDTITTVFRTITSVNQLSLDGAVAEMCEEYESFHDRTVKPVVGGQLSS